jgi:hypothetical protein
LILVVVEVVTVADILDLTLMVLTVDLATS